MRFEHIVTEDKKKRARCVFLTVPLTGVQDGKDYDLTYYLSPLEAVKLGFYMISKGIILGFLRIVDKLIGASDE